MPATTAPATTLGTPSIETLEALLNVTYTWGYQETRQKLRDLYDKAVRAQWIADDVLPWSTDVDLDKPMGPEILMPLFGSDIWNKMSAAERHTMNIETFSWTLSQFLHGEQGALMTAACVTHSVPDAVAKLYAATQTMDEARHVEVYARYCDKIAMVYPMSPWLKALIDTTLKSDRYEKVMIGMNMIVEGLALGAFNNMYHSTTCPLLKAITFNVMRDESRHVSFGFSYLGPVIAKLDEAAREELADFAFEAIRVVVEATMKGDAQGLASRADPGFLEVLANCGIDADDFFKGLEEAAEQGILQELPPGQIHSLNDLMMPAIARVGLITPRVRKRYEEARIPIFDDVRVLHALEGGSPQLQAAE